MLDTQKSLPAKDKSSCNRNKCVRVCAGVRRCTLMRGYANLFAHVGVCLSVFLHRVLLEEDSSSPESLSCSAVEPPAKGSKTSAYAERPVQSGIQKAGKM